MQVRDIQSIVTKYQYVFILKKSLKSVEKNDLKDVIFLVSAFRFFLRMNTFLSSKYI